MRWLFLLTLVSLAACGSVTDPSANGQPDAAPMVSCTSSTECPDESPVCGGDGVCQGCSAENSCDGSNGRGLECRGDGQCVSCIDDSMCGDVQSVCDVEAGQCRGCVSNEECPSDVCDLLSATCADEADVVYLAATGPPSTTCTRNAPCNELETAYGLLSGPRRFLRILPGTYGASFQFENQNDGPLVIAAQGAVFDWNATGAGAEGLQFEGSPSTIIYGGTYRGILATRAIECIASPMTIVGATIEQNAIGFESRGGNGCVTQIYDSVFRQNTLSISVDFDEVVIERNLFEDDLSHSLSLNGEFLVRNNLFVGNNTQNAAVVNFFGSTAALPNASVFAHNTVANNSLGTNPSNAVVDCNLYNNGIAIVGNIISANNGADSLQGCGENGPGGGPFRVVTDNILVGPIPPTGKNTTLTPLFSDPENNDYTLTSDVGVDEAGPLFSPPDDFRGNSRPAGGAPDIGAFESQ